MLKHCKPLVTQVRLITVVAKLEKKLLLFEFSKPPWVQLLFARFQETLHEVRTVNQ